ncbi:lipopolysaccharide biosynthesis protein [Serratia fonticola]|uniref:lipopolysaccharide biosynthesis protein n=1 Tax=Serratia fonticola TaxID=47917 RepID=UPI0024DEC7F1|nr:hypothetical protein [Serratia fonticola]MDK2375913.1 hypothetical protein [Serratia fonticola]
MFVSRMLGLSLRGATLASKFLLVIFLARYFSIDVMGQYALFTASVSYALFIVGLDFYTFSSREILSSNDSKIQAKLIRDQFVFYLISYVFVFPLLLIIFFYKLLPSSFIFWFYTLLILEHISQELVRLLVVMKKNVLANLVYFIRAGSWVYISIGIMFFYVPGRSLDFILLSWSIGGAVSILISLYGLRSLSVFKLESSINWIWMLQGIRVALPLLFGTLSLRAIYTADRYILQWFDSTSSVGIYGFYSSFSSALLAFIDATVVMQYYPRVVENFKCGNLEAYNIISKEFLRSIVFMGAFISICLAVLMNVLPFFIGKPEYSNSIGVFYILLSGAFVFAISLVPHYQLYAQGRDFELILSSFMAFIGAIFSMFILGMYFGMPGVALGQFIGLVILAVSKYICVLYGRNTVHVDAKKS